MPDVFIDPEPHHVATEETRRPGEPLPHKGVRPRKVSIFSTFVRDPAGIALAEQHDDEHILVFIRRAFVTNTPWLFFTVVFLILPFFLPFLFSPLNLPADFLTLSALVILTVFYYIVVVGFAFANFLTWFYDIGIVTEKRAVDIDFYNISYMSVATARAQDLKDVRYAQKGFFESLFDYGDVTLVVEASGETLTFENTPRPAEVVSILSALIGGHQA
jgi:hypothetical protein